MESEDEDFQAKGLVEILENLASPLTFENIKGECVAVFG
jgi:hypothetical protein